MLSSDAVSTLLSQETEKLTLHLRPPPQHVACPAGMDVVLHVELPLLIGNVVELLGCEEINHIEVAILLGESLGMNG